MLLLLLPPKVFVSTKARAQQLHKELMYDGVHVDSISGDQVTHEPGETSDNDCVQQQGDMPDFLCSDC